MARVRPKPRLCSEKYESLTRMAASVASTSAPRSDWLPRPIEVERRLPPDSLLRGQIFADDASRHLPSDPRTSEADRRLTSAPASNPYSLGGCTVFR
jgi:hypothetical protein